jgi:hypothetical protein
VNLGEVVDMSDVNKDMCASLPGSQHFSTFQHISALHEFLDFLEPQNSVNDDDASKVMGDSKRRRLQHDGSYTTDTTESGSDEASDDDDAEEHPEEPSEAVQTVFGCEDLVSLVCSFLDGRSKVLVVPLICKTSNRALLRPSSWPGIIFTNRDQDDAWHERDTSKVLGHLSSRHTKLSTITFPPSDSADTHIDAIMRLWPVQLRSTSEEDSLWFTFKAHQAAKQRLIGVAQTNRPSKSALLTIELMLDVKPDDDLALLEDDFLVKLNMHNMSSEQFRALDPSKLPKLTSLYSYHPAEEVADLSTAIILSQLQTLKMSYGILLENLPAMLQLRELKLDIWRANGEHTSTKRLVDWLVAAPNLTNLTLCSIECEDTLFAQIIQLQQLTKIKLIFTNWEIESANDNVNQLRQLVDNLPALQELQMFSNKYDLHWSNVNGSTEFTYNGSPQYLQYLDPLNLPPCNRICLSDNWSDSDMDDTDYDDGLSNVLSDILCSDADYDIDDLEECHRQLEICDKLRMLAIPLLCAEVPRLVDALKHATRADTISLSLFLREEVEDIKEDEILEALQSLRELADALPNCNLNIVMIENIWLPSRARFSELYERTTGGEISFRMFWRSKESS